MHIKGEEIQSQLVNRVGNFTSHSQWEFWNGSVGHVEILN